MTMPAHHEGRARAFSAYLCAFIQSYWALWRDIPAAFGAVKGQSAASTGASVRLGQKR